jgi:hypothetical protein
MVSWNRQCKVYVIHAYSQALCTQQIKNWNNSAIWGQHVYQRTNPMVTHPIQAQKSEPLTNNRTCNLAQMKSKTEMSAETIGQPTGIKNWPFSNVSEVVSLLCSFVKLHCVQYVLEEWTVEWCSPPRKEWHIPVMFLTLQGPHFSPVGSCGTSLCPQWEKMDQVIWKSELEISQFHSCENGQVIN